MEKVMASAAKRYAVLNDKHKSGKVRGLFDVMGLSPVSRPAALAGIITPDNSNAPKPVFTGGAPVLFSLARCRG